VGGGRPGTQIAAFQKIGKFSATLIARQGLLNGSNYRIFVFVDAPIHRIEIIYASPGNPLQFCGKMKTSVGPASEIYPLYSGVPGSAIQSPHLRPPPQCGRYNRFFLP
jgi:hypothetical protein